MTHLSLSHALFFGDATRIGYDCILCRRTRRDTFQAFDLFLAELRAVHILIISVLVDAFFFHGVLEVININWLAEQAHLKGLNLLFWLYTSKQEFSSIVSLLFWTASIKLYRKKKRKLFKFLRTEFGSSALT